MRTLCLAGDSDILSFGRRPRVCNFAHPLGQLREAVQVCAAFSFARRSDPLINVRAYKGAQICSPRAGLVRFLLLGSRTTRRNLVFPGDSKTEKSTGGSIFMSASLFSHHRRSMISLLLRAFFLENTPISLQIVLMAKKICSSPPLR